MAEPTYAEAMAAYLRDGCEHGNRLCPCKIGVSLIERRTVAELFPDACAALAQVGDHHEANEVNL